MVSPAALVGPTKIEAGASGTRKDGSRFPVEQSVSHVQLGARTVQIVCLHDVAEREAYIEALKHQALHDALTGLPNRVLFRERLSHAITRSARTGEPLAVLIVDLDDFKHVNDTMGHHNGDSVLRLVADRLVACLRDSDTVSRLSGDEFAILPLDGTDLSAAATVAWKVQAALDAPFVIGEHSVQLSASIGMALVPEHGDNIDDLMRRADLAMYDAKRHRSRCALFALEQEEAPARRLELLDNLRHCVERDELVLHYQPKIDLTTGETIGLEALIRWNHPSGRLMRPVEFMPEVEGNELMISITRWVINAALAELRRLRDQGFDLTMAVNLGARCLAHDAGLLETVEAMTTAWGIPPESLSFELTESALIDTSLPALLAQLEAIDQGLSIDDFGTGYSSLVYLQRLPVVEVKADRSFVMTMASVESDAVIVRSIVDLAHNLSVKVVAEGVEDEETMKMLIDYGCDEAQGYYFARPMPGAAVANWLELSPFGVPRRLPVATPGNGALPPSAGNGELPPPAVNGALPPEAGAAYAGDGTPSAAPQRS
jgi:diguanylate cyclase (GGDEF)-like protein